MKRISISETPWMGSAVEFVTLTFGREPTLLRRITRQQGVDKFNVIIVYEPGDEIYEHWDAMYAWEEPDKPKSYSGLEEYIKSVPMKKADLKRMYGESILEKELRKIKKDYTCKISKISEDK